MSQFDDLMTQGFSLMLQQCKATITVEATETVPARTAECVPGSSAKELELRNSGLWENGMVIVELFRREVVRLGIEDRTELTYTPETPAKGPARRMKAMIFDDDPSDPCVRLTLKPNPRPAS